MDMRTRRTSEFNAPDGLTGTGREAHLESVPRNAPAKFAPQRAIQSCGSSYATGAQPCCNGCAEGASASVQATLRHRDTRGFRAMSAEAPLIENHVWVRREVSTHLMIDDPLPPGDAGIDEVIVRGEPRRFDPVSVPEGRGPMVSGDPPSTGSSGNQPSGEGHSIGKNQGQADGRTYKEALERSKTACAASFPSGTQLEFSGPLCWRSGTEAWTCIVLCNPRGNPVAQRGPDPEDPRDTRKPKPGRGDA